MKVLFLTLLVLFIPLPSVAAVIISEVAWMGSSVSANHEWIELHNTGEAVDLSGWTLSDGNNLTISLTGTVGATSYAVLERTSDDSAPGTALLLYTGALPNTGATLTLRRADGGIEDQVAGGTDWNQIGGDNSSKYTAQYTSSGWVTAPATPGAINAATTVISTPVTSTSSAAKAPSSGGSKLAEPAVRPVVVKNLTLPNDELVLTINSPTIGYVHQLITFTVTPEGLGKTLLDSLTYEWNPGDGRSVTGGGTTMLHTFTHPGRYVVSVYGSFARHEAEGRFEITILPVTLSLTKNDSGDVQINNDAQYEISLEGYRLQAEKTVTLPPRTYLLPQQTITISEKRLGATHTVTLRDAENTVVAVLGLPPSTDAPLLSAQSISYEGAASNVISRSEVPDALAAPFGFATTALHSSTSTPAQRLQAPASTTAGVLLPVQNNNLNSTWWPYVAFIVLILGTIGLLLVQPDRRRGSSNTHE